MNDEIKETLEYKIDFLTKSLNIGIPTKSRRYFNDIKDYITNLQQNNTDKQLEIMKLKDRLEKQRKEYQETYKDVRIELKEKNETITNLQQENERLKNEPLTNKLGRIDSVVANIYRNNKEQEDYKSRCEKINEILKESPDFNYSNDYIILKRKIEEALQGSDSQ